MPECRHCGAALPGPVRLIPLRFLQCDLCSDSIRTCGRPIAVPNPTALVPTPDERKSKRRKGRKVNAVATALVFMLLPLIGCTLHRECTLDVRVDPALLRSQPAPETAAEIPTLEFLPTES